MALESFNAYHSYLTAIEPLNDAERGRLFTALLIYSSTGEVPDLRGNERFVFPQMKWQIDRDKGNYNDFCARQSENGKKGGRPKKPSVNSERVRVVNIDFVRVDYKTAGSVCVLGVVADCPLGFLKILAIYILPASDSKCASFINVHETMFAAGTLNAL
jgi:hypothetical protein